MKKTGKIILSVFSVFSVLSLIFWVGAYFCGACSYLYLDQEVKNHIIIFFALSVLVLVVCAVMVILMLKGKKVIRVVCTTILILSIPGSLLGSFVWMLGTGIIGPYGCSYTEDIANYGKYDKDFNIHYFPKVITEDMTVVDFSYFHKYIDTDQTDIYLEIKFDNKDTMDKYLQMAKNSFSENGFLTHDNPYKPKYTDIIENKMVLLSDNKYASHISFEGDENYKYVDMSYYLITYSYDDFTIIYNYTGIGSDLKVGNKPNDGEYYPKILHRFGVEWNPANNFGCEFVGKQDDS